MTRSDRWDGLDDFLARVALRLDAPGAAPRLTESGDADFLTEDEQRNIRPAAVLIGILPRATGAAALLTLRPDTMADHAGQVAFPGGKIDAQDSGPVAAALREAEEEVGVPTSVVRVIGLGEAYITGTRYRITPVIGVLPADFVARPDPSEVADVFETPLSLLMDPQNHRAAETFYKGKHRRYYEIPHDGHRIWGVTAGIIRRLYETLYRPGIDG